MLRKTARPRVNPLLFMGDDISYTVDQIPILDKVEFIYEDKFLLRPIRMAMPDKHNIIGHFYIDDFQFESFWLRPERYLEYLRDYKSVVSPDFSVYSNMPMPVIMFNIYKNALLALIWQRNGVNVIPNITWPVGRIDNKFIDPFASSNIAVISNIGLSKSEMDIFEKELSIFKDYPQFETIIIYGTSCKASLINTAIVQVKHYINIRKHE